MDGSVGPDLGIENILLKCCDKILIPPFCLPTHTMEGTVKIWETNQKSEEITHF